MSGAERPPGHPLLIEPVVAWPRQADAGCDYLVTVDLRGPLPAPDGTLAEWPYGTEEFTFTVALDGAPHFSCAALGEPSVVLHRFGGTYGPARFRVSAGAGTGPASLWLTVSNQWGVPVRKAELRSHIRDGERAPDRDRQPAGPVEDMPRPPVLRPGSDGSRTRRQPVRPTPEPGRPTVTVSFTGFNRAWAVWIGSRLERRGVPVRYAPWEPSADVPPADLLRDLRLAEGRVLIVLSERYFPLGPRTQEEWNAALREVVAPDPSRFAAVSVTTAAVPSAAAVLAPVDLTSVGAEEAERRLLDRLDLPSDPLPETPAESRGPRYPAALPDVWGSVPRRNTRFTGREALLNEAYGLLQAAEPGAGVITLYGMSGVGKTQLAAEYAHRFGSEYDVVWWVNAEKRVTYRRQLAELAPKLGLQTGREYGERLRAVRDSLRRGDPYSRWLLILDGADEPGQIWDLVPTGPGHVVVTSRNPEWGERDSTLLEVPVYARDESVAFIRRRAPRVTEAEADQLAELLEDLPLLLDQTAGWLNDSHLSVEEYIALLEGGIDSHVVKVSPDFPIAFRTAWSMLLNQLRETVPESVELLRLCTFFAPGSIPVHLLRDMPLDGLPRALAELLSDARLWDRAVDQLRRYSVVRVEPHEADDARETFYLHRAVHQIVHRDIPEAQREELIDVVRRALAAAAPGRPADPDRWPDYAEIVPHLKYADVLAGTDPAVQTLVLDCLRYMYLSGEYAAGVKLGRRAMRAWRQLLAESHPLIWELTYHYANLLRAAGDYQRTLQIERAAVRHLEQRGERDPDLLRALGGLAADLRGLGHYAEALEMSRRVLATYRELLGDQDTRTLNAQNNVAVSLRLLGRYEDARDVDLRTLEARRGLLGDRHPWTLGSEIAYAVDLRLLGRYAEAEAVQARNLLAGHEALGGNSTQALRAEHNLALCLYAVGDLGSAAHHFSRALERCERVLGEHDPLTLIFAAGQSCFDRAHGDLGRARELSESVVARYEVMFPDKHPFIAGVRANQALILRDAGERQQGHALVEQALDEMTDTVGENHPWTLGCALNAAALRALVGDPGHAADLGRDTADRAARVLGPAHPLTLSALVSLAADLRALGRRTEADGVERRALAALDATLGARHPLTVAARARHRPHWDFEPQNT
ncbi:FxSxx-COOH system tetratricopeptide repeat protein [Streptomyces sp. DH24]|uniref:FxSxx-COOH system tetratricopeptide repeat protein n=1 Tax=Streptomyces sp. DH24 TaxID=3040123 RepID=UPI002442BEF0|nr:FxSxx-COOH system tetratricopeptide repeat protein [Streptomyces sp. DH24]MDG9716552.1 FxSxx-COOH system tetratricopeptide repeat protein [Streptomyces sp. DH24]